MTHERARCFKVSLKRLKWHRFLATTNLLRFADIFNWRIRQLGGCGVVKARLLDIVVIVTCSDLLRRGHSWCMPLLLQSLYFASDKSMPHKFKPSQANHLLADLLLEDSKRLVSWLDLRNLACKEISVVFVIKEHIRLVNYHSVGDCT